MASKKTALSAAFVIALATATAGCSGASSGVQNESSKSAHVTVQPPAELADSGQITFCSSLTNPPREFRDNGQPKGSDVELATAIADQMGLTPKWVQSTFDGLIPALQGQRCDAIVDELFIKPEREAVIKMLPYSTSAEQTVVPKGNPQGISDLESLSGHKVGVTNGTTYQALLMDYNKKLKSEGKEPATLVTFPSTADMFNQLISGTVEAAGGTLSSSVYYEGKAGGQLELAGDPFGAVSDGLGFRKNDTKLYDAVQEAFGNLRDNGTYEEIFKKYGLEGETLPQGK